MFPPLLHCHNDQPIPLCAAVSSHSQSLSCGTAHNYSWHPENLCAFYFQGRSLDSLLVEHRSRKLQVAPVQPLDQVFHRHVDPRCNSRRVLLEDFDHAQVGHRLRRFHALATFLDSWYSAAVIRGLKLKTRISFFSQHVPTSA